MEGSPEGHTNVARDFSPWSRCLSLNRARQGARMVMSHLRPPCVAVNNFDVFSRGQRLLAMLIERRRSGARGESVLGVGRDAVHAFENDIDGLGVLGFMVDVLDPPRIRRVLVQVRVQIAKIAAKPTAARR